MKITLVFQLFFVSLTCLAQAQNTIEFQNKREASSKITLGFTGDLLVHKDLYLEVISSKKEDFSILWEKTKPLIEAADYTYTNLEGPTALGINNKRQDVGDIGFTYDDSVYSGTNMLFNFHPQIIDALRKTGFDIVSTANNHTFDRGSIGIDKTIDALKAREFSFAGTRKKGDQSPLYTITSIKDFRIAWIACSEALNGFKDTYSQILLCFNQSEEIIKSIKEIKNKNLADAVIVLPHWGVEYEHTPTNLQKKYARLFLDAGAAAVMGNHPHVIQPVEKYITQDQRETFISYSLGNFLAFQRDIDRKASAFIYLEFSKDQNQNTWISNYSYQPTVRVNKEILPAAKIKEVVKHVEQYLGPFKN